MRELRRESPVFHNDPGHGWLEAKYEDLVELEIQNKISHYSYRSGDTVYLEEDQDLTIYVKALWYEMYMNEEFKIWWKQIVSKYEEESFIRNLMHYEI